MVTNKESPVNEALMSIPCGVEPNTRMTGTLFTTKALKSAYWTSRPGMGGP